MVPRPSKAKLPWWPASESFKAGFVVSDSNLRPDSTLADVLALKEKTGHSTMAVTSDGSKNGHLEGIVTSRDYRISRMNMEDQVKNFMTPVSEMVVGTSDITETNQRYHLGPQAEHPAHRGQGRQPDVHGIPEGLLLS